jgi:uncharacterized OB-fold protein
MRKRLLYTCKCGRWIKRPQNVCEYCSSTSKYIEVNEPTFLLTNEISDGNFDVRLKEGFKLLGND